MNRFLDPKESLLGYKFRQYGVMSEQAVSAKGVADFWGHLGSHPCMTLHRCSVRA